MKKLGVVFVGGGNATVALLDLFISDEGLRVLGVVDPNPGAAGIVHAHKLRIKTAKDMKEMVTDARAEIIVEVTGSLKVKQSIIDLMRPDQHVMTAAAAKVLVELIEEQQKEREKIFKLSGNINHSSERIDSTVSDIIRVLREMKILAINANVEAARLGNDGKSFAIVADRMSELTVDVQKAIDNITIASRENREFLHAFEQ